MEQGIGYRHDLKWWARPENAKRAKEFRMVTRTTANQPKGNYAQTPSVDDDRKHTHGDADVYGLERRVYFDLGGYYDLVDEEAYAYLADKINTGAATTARLVSAVDLGYSPQGVPLDVACSTDECASSVVFIKKWMRLSYTLITDQGRRFTLSQRLLGFVPRSTPLLILGRSTCQLCGYRTIEQQDQECATFVFQAERELDQPCQVRLPEPREDRGYHSESLRVHFVAVRDLFSFRDQQDGSYIHCGREYRPVLLHLSVWRFQAVA